MFERFQKLFDRVESRIALWQVVAGSSLLTGGVSAWLASFTDWLYAAGPIAWWYAALLGCLVGLAIILVAVGIRYLWIRSGALRKWEEKVDDFNPLDSDFHRKRLRFSDLAHPVTNSINGKTLVDCELLGPANILMRGGGSFIGIELTNCDVVALRTAPQLRINNVIVLNNTSITNGSIWNCTIYVPPGMVRAFQEMGAEFITAIEGLPTSNQSQQDTEQRTQR